MLIALLVFVFNLRHNSRIIKTTEGNNERLINSTELNNQSLIESTSNNKKLEISAQLDQERWKDFRTLNGELSSLTMNFSSNLDAMIKTAFDLKTHSKQIRLLLPSIDNSDAINTYKHH